MSTVWFAMARCWFPCSGHILSQSTHRSASWTLQSPHNVHPSCPRIPRTPFLLESGRAGFLWDDESRFLFPWVAVPSLWYFTVRSFCLKVRLKCTGGLRSDDCDHWQTYLQVDIWTSDYLLKTLWLICTWIYEIIGISFYMGMLDKVCNFNKISHNYIIKLCL